MVLVLATVVIPSLELAPLERAEIYFLDASRGMVESGDWLVPLYRGEPFFDKPPLTYWAMALAQLWLGATPGAARVVPAAAALLVLVSTLWLGMLLFDRRSALAGGTVLATTFAFVTFGHVAMSDMLLALFTTLGAALAVRAIRPPAPSWLLPALGAVLGLGFLTKGPIALLLAGIPLAILYRRERIRPRLLPLAAAILSFAVFGLGWFVLVYLRLGSEPLQYFFLRENLQRFAGEAYDVGRPIWFYLPTYFAEGVPWSLFVPLAALRLRRDESGREDVRLLAAWIILALAPLSLSRGKIDYYLLPLYPALSLLVGRFFVAVPWRALDRGWARAVLLATAGALLVLLRARARIPAEWLPTAGPQRLLVLVAGAAALACVLASLRPTPARVLATLAGAVWGMSFVLVSFFLPAFWKGQPNRAIVSDVAREQLWRPDATVALCQDPSRAQRDILFHARVAVEERCDLWALAASRSPYLLLVRPEERASFRVIPGFREIDRYRYLPATALTLGGLLRPPSEGELVLGANYATTDPEAERKNRRVGKKLRFLEQFHPELSSPEAAERFDAARPREE